MTFIEFRDDICGRVRGLLGEEYRVSVREVPKNNGTVLSGLIIEKQGVDFSPSIYLEPFFEEYQNGRELQIIGKEILLLYESCDVENTGKTLDMSFFKEFESVKSKVAFKLVNFEKNKEMLKSVPYIPYLDLAIVFYCRILSEGIGIGSILITNAHLLLWGITKDQLYEAAKENTPKILPCEMKNMKEVIGELITRNTTGKQRRETVPDSIPENWRKQWEDQILNLLTPEVLSDREKALFVLGNRDRIQGAAAIIYRGVLQDVADHLDKDIYVLPSSIHEVILMPDDGVFRGAQLSEMVREVNETQLLEQEVLSEHVYLFDRKKGQLKIAG